MSVVRSPARQTDEDDDSSDAVTYARDIAPILQQNCQMCHQPGSIAPMSFLTYEEVRPWAPLIKVRTEERAMPPYHYDPGVGILELKDDRRLSEKEIETIARWVDGGAPLGDPAKMPAPIITPVPMAIAPERVMLFFS